MSREPDDDSPYHVGERELQQRMGVRDRSEQMGRRVIRAFMPDQHRELLGELPLVFLGSLDRAGNPWASVLTGEPGFLGTPDPETLVVRAQPAPGDPLAESLHAGAPLGVLAIQLETRRRNRVNGRVVEVAAEGFALHVDQSFGNCPKYITARRPKLVHATAASKPRAETAVLSSSAVACIAASDTCFIATASSRAAELPSDDAREGVDVSHRGGKPGFVRVDRAGTQTTLVMPDFAGNNAYNTLGNLARYPRAGLLFLSFATGDVLQLTCDTEIVWDGPEVERFEGAQRLVRFGVRAGRFFEHQLALRWFGGEPAPQLAKTGAW